MQENHEEKNAEKSLATKLVESAMAGQAAVLDAQLKAGFPLKYVDDNGDYVQKNPDGTITLLERKNSHV